MPRTWLRTLRNQILVRFFGGAKHGGTLGIYGVPNAGKTLLANRICVEWLAGEVGVSSPVPHETRAIARRDSVTLESGENKLRLNVVDTPGIASSVSAKELAEYCHMTPEEARRHAREATEGILAAIDYLATVDGMLLVVDAAGDPAAQANATLLAHVRARQIPLVVAANKVDLRGARPQAVAKAFDPYPVVPVSALTGQNLPRLYEVMVREFA